MTARVKRGPKSWAKFYGVHGVALFILLHLVFVADITRGYRVLASMGNALAITYLALLNGWFRNKLLIWMSKLEERPD